MKTAFALALTAAVFVAPQANAGVCCMSVSYSGLGVSQGYDCTTGSCGPGPQHVGHLSIACINAANRVVAFWKDTHACVCVLLLRRCCLSDSCSCVHTIPADPPPYPLPSKSPRCSAGTSAR